MNPLTPPIHSRLFHWGNANFTCLRSRAFGLLGSIKRLTARRVRRRAISHELGDHAEFSISDMAAKPLCLLFTFYYGFNTGAPASVANHLSVMAANVPSVVIVVTAESKVERTQVTSAAKIPKRFFTLPPYG